jgi:nucleotide-binding universal stress UspA family protein
MPYRVLVPLDGSPLAETILAPLRRLAEEAALEAVLLGVLGLPPQVDAALMLLPSLRYGAAGAEVRRLGDEADRALDAYLRERAERLGANGVPARALLCRGEPAREIVRVAAEEAVDAVWMSTHGRTGLEHMVHGSVAEAVLRAAGRPVLLLRPERAAFERLRAERAQAPPPPT